MDVVDDCVVADVDAMVLEHDWLIVDIIDVISRSDCFKMAFSTIMIHLVPACQLFLHNGPLKLINNLSKLPDLGVFAFLNLINPNVKRLLP